VWQHGSGSIYLADLLSKREPIKVLPGAIGAGAFYFYFFISLVIQLTPQQ